MLVVLWSTSAVSTGNDQDTAAAPENAIPTSMRHALSMQGPLPPLDLIKIATAFERNWREAEIRPQLGLEHVSVRDGDLYVKYWSTGPPALHAITVRGEDLLAIDARDLGAFPVGDPNQCVASWLEVIIVETVDSGPPSPAAFVLDLGA